MEAVAEDEQRPAVLSGHERAVRQRGQRRGMPPPSAGRVAPCGVQDAVHVPGVRCWWQSGRRPGGAEGPVVGAPAFGAGPVPVGEGHGLVEEEELGEPARPQKRPAAALELRQAGDPEFRTPLPPDDARIVVQAAAVAEQQPARGVSDDVREGRDAVPQRHVRSLRRHCRRPWRLAISPAAPQALPRSIAPRRRKAAGKCRARQRPAGPIGRNRPMSGPAPPEPVNSA